jgi:RHS repeat-associated protein
MTDYMGQTTYTYDALNRLTGVVFPRVNLGQTFAVSYGYDVANVCPVGPGRTLTYPGGKVATYCYDQAYRLKTVTDWNGKTATYDYDTAGRLQDLQYPNGTDATYGYDDADRLTNVTNQFGANVASISLDTYKLDGDGQPTQATELAGTNTFTYDELDRLKTESYPGAATTTYGYTATGNRQTVTLGTNSPTTYKYDGAGRLTSDGTNSYTYDKNGNQLTQNRDAYAYDGANRLITFTSYRSSSPSRDNFYNGDGLRVATQTALGGLTEFVYDVSAPNPVVLYDGQWYYVYGLGLLARISADNATTQYFHQDGLGSTRAITDAQGTTLATYAYNAFGAPRVQTGTATTAYQFTGEPLDSDTDLYYLRARWYNPGTGRFTAPDPLGYAGGDNPYAYAGNNPTSAVDHSGLFAWWIAGAVVGGVGGFAAYTATHHDDFSWREAAQWTAGGALLGGTFGLAGDAAAAFGVGGATIVAGEAGAAASSQVILDTNAVIRYSDAERLLDPEEDAVITRTTVAELNNLVARGTIKGMPRVASRLEVIDDVMAVNARINIRGAISAMGVTRRGLFGDGSIGATAERLGLPVITGDKNFGDVLAALGVEVRRLP